MAVVLDLLQSGSGSTKISAQAADTITFKLNETVYSNVLDQVVGKLSALTDVTGVNFAFSNAGNAGIVLNIAQSGSGSTAIAAAAGDTVTLSLAETVFSNVLDQAVAAFDALSNVTGVLFAFNNGGGAN